MSSTLLLHAHSPPLPAPRPSPPYPTPPHPETAKGVLQEHLTTTFLYTGLFQSIPLLRPLKVGLPGTGAGLPPDPVSRIGAPAELRLQP